MIQCISIKFSFVLFFVPLCFYFCVGNVQIAMGNNMQDKPKPTSPCTNICSYLKWHPHQDTHGYFVLSEICFTCGHVWVLKPLVFREALQLFRHETYVKSVSSSGHSMCMYVTSTVPKIGAVHYLVQNIVKQRHLKGN